MVLRRFFGATALFVTLLAVGAPVPVQADCPAGSGIEIPLLTDPELRCQKYTYNATVEFLGANIDARQDCYLRETDRQFIREDVDCNASLADGGTGDEKTDNRLRAAEAAMTRKILTHCVNVDLRNLGYPGFCPDPDGGIYEAFDHNICLQDVSRSLVEFIMDVEHPPFPGFLELNERVCGDFLARSSANMTRAEIDHRGRCLLKQLQRLEDEETDCRRELDPQRPDTGRNPTDERVVEAHNSVLRGIANHCPVIDLEAIGFPHRCSFTGPSQFPLPALVECMFDFHHQEIFRVLDILFPCSTDCGNAILDPEELCDDGDNEFAFGDFCRRNCTSVACGDPNDSGQVNATDALFVLRTAVGLESCDLQVCDANGDLRTTASDALRVLMFSVGLPVGLNCPILSPTCGNGFLETLEECDDDDTDFSSGDFCNATCFLVDCGDPNDSGHVNIIDAQYILNVAVDNLACDLSVCDITGNGSINSTDALRTLMHSVGLPVIFNCPDPPVTPPGPPLE